jgi:hypothetical protein
MLEKVDEGVYNQPLAAQSRRIVCDAACQPGIQVLVQVVFRLKCGNILSIRQI